MSADVQCATPQQQAEIVRLFTSVFGPEMPPGLLSPEFLDWKFFAPRPDWSGCRSFVICEQSEILAHACVWPLSFLFDAEEIRSCHLIDWAARPEAPGTGLVLYRHLMGMNEAVLAVGGSEAARKLLPKLGFQDHGTLDIFARVVRPWRQFRSRPRRTDWRETARLARNSFWSLGDVAAPPAEWSAVPISDLRDLPEGALRLHASSFCFGIRSASLLRYFLDCPAATCSFFTLSRAGIPLGYFLLNDVSGQCRIADLAIDSEKPRDWESAYRLAALIAARRETTCEIKVVSSLPWLSDIFRRNGFRLRGQSPIMLYDPGRRFAKAPPLHLRMTDSDDFFLYAESAPFVT